MKGEGRKKCEGQRRVKGEEGQRVRDEVTFLTFFSESRQDNPNEPMPEDEYSLRAYLSILYLEPRMKLILNGKKVVPKRLLYSLYNTREITYVRKFEKL